MQRLPLVICLTLVSCMADLYDGAVVEVAQEPSRVPGPWSPALDNLTGPCSDACKLAASGTCEWDEMCVHRTSERPDRMVAICGGRVLACEAFDRAGHGGVTDIAVCYRGCEGLK